MSRANLIRTGFSIIAIALNALPMDIEARNKSQDDNNQDIISIIDCMQVFNGHIIKAYQNPKEVIPISSLSKDCGSQIVELEKNLFLNNPRIQDSSLASPLKLYLNSSLTLKENSLNYSQYVDLVNEQIARRNPSISFDLNFSMYSLNYLKCTNNSNSPVGTLCSEVISYKPYAKPQNYYQFGSVDSPNINLSYDLFNREQDMSIMSEKSNLKAQGSYLEKQFQDFSENTLKKLDGISKAQQNIIIRKSNEMLYRRSLDIAKYQLEIGFQTTVGVDKLKSSLSKAESQLIKALSDYQKKISEFITYTSSYEIPMENISFINNKFSELPLDNPQGLIERAIKTNPQFKMIEFQLDQIGYQILSKRAKKYPTLSLSLGVGLEKTGIMYDSSLKNNSSSSQFSGTLGIAWDLYDSGLTKSLVSSKKKKLAQSKLQLQQLTLSTSNKIESLVSQINASNKELQERIKAVESSESAVRGTQARLLAGFEDTTSLIQTVEQYIIDQEQLVNSVYDGANLYRQLAFITQNLNEFNTGKDIQKSIAEHKSNANSINYPNTYN